jgi:hypothetical protein
MVGSRRAHGPGNLSSVVGDLQRLVAKAASPFHRLLEARVLHRLQQIVDGAGFERLHRVLVESRHDDDDGHRLTREVAHHLETAHDGHLQVEKDQFRPEFLDLLQRGSAIVRLSDHFHVGKQFESLPEHKPGDRLVIDDKCLHGARFHSHLKIYRRLT